MKMRVIVVAIAALAGLALLGVTRLMQQPPVDVAPATPPEHADPPPGFHRDTAVTSPHQLSTDMQAQRYRLDWITEGGQLVQFEGREYSPLPDRYAKVTEPRMLIHLERRQRVLEVSAAEGMFYAPENQPQFAELSGGLVIRLLEAPRDEALRLDAQSPHLQLRCEMTHARFDFALSLASSDSAVTVRGRRIDFDGRGFELVFNDLRKRIDRLSIHEGRSLTVRGARLVRGGGADAGARGDATEPAPAGGDATGSVPATSDAGASDAGAPPGAAPMTVYHLHLKENVRATHPEGTLSSQWLDLIFAAEAQDQAQTLAAPAGSETSPPAGSPPAAGGAVAPTEPATAPATDPDAVAADELHVAWEGSLLLTALSEIPPGFTDPDDVIVSAGGPRTHVVWNNPERPLDVTATEVLYFSRSGKLQAEGTPAHPLVVVAPGTGSLQGQGLAIASETGEGVIRGPGVLRGKIDSGERRQPAMVRFQDRVDLTFFPGSRDTESGHLQLGDLGSATVHGAAHLEHPWMDLAAEMLTVDLSDPRSGPQIVTHVRGQGRVRARIERPQDEAASTLAAERMTLELERSQEGDEATPSRLIASGNADLQQGGKRLEAQEVDVVLAADRGGPEAAESTEDGSAEREERRHIERLVARGDVRIALPERDLRLAGAELTGDSGLEHIVLAGSQEKPAEAHRTSGSLYGPRIVADADRRIVAVQGAGRFELRDEAGEPDANAERDAAPRATIAWADSMRINDTDHHADFIGQVVVQSQTASDATTLESDALRVEFRQSLEALDAAGSTGQTSGEATEETTADDAPQERGVAPSPQAAPSDASRAVGAIRRAVATGNVQFESRTSAAGEPDTIASLARIAGPTLTFDGDAELITVSGSGTMQLLDARRTDAADDGPDPAEAGDDAASPIAFDGPGASVFKWQEKMTLDAKTNDLTMVGQVQMLFRALERGTTVQLDAGRMVADLAETGGLGGWLADEPMQPALIAAEAHENVRVRHAGRDVTADHLRYDAAADTMVLTVDEGRRVEILDTARNQRTTAKRIHWDLGRDAIEFLELGPARIPVEPGE